MTRIKLLIFIIICSTCSGCLENNHIKKVEYGEQIFLASYDALMSDDYLKLYDNNLFEIIMPDLVANGKYKIEADTIFFEYFKYSGNMYQAYLMKQGGIYELEKKNGHWDYSKNDTYLGIHEDKSFRVYQPEPKYTALILVESDTTIAQNFYKKFCGEKGFDGVNGFNTTIIKNFTNWHGWYYPITENDSLVDRLLIGHTKDDYLILGLSFYGFSDKIKEMNNRNRANRLLEILESSFNVISSFVKKDEYPYKKTETILEKADFDLEVNKTANRVARREQNHSR